MSLHVGSVVWFQPDSISQVPWVDLIRSRVSADMSSPHSMASGSAESDSVTCVQKPRQRRDPTPVISTECPWSNNFRQVPFVKSTQPCIKIHAIPLQALDARRIALFEGSQLRRPLRIVFI